MNINLVQSGALRAAGGGSSAASGGSVPVGQAFYGFGSGAYTWTCPPGVTSVSAVCIGGGASSQSPNWNGQAGGGGGLGWRNNITVTPGQTYSLFVGRGGDGRDGSTNGGTSWFITSSLVSGGGGVGTSGGGFTGEGGGNGGGSGQYGGGGAGGYTGNGGGPDASGSGGGAAGGGSYSSTHGGAGGGGTGPFGQGSSGSGGGTNGGQGGSGGEDGVMGENPWWSQGTLGSKTGGLYGGGGGGTGTNDTFGRGMNRGGRGCVRIIWGPNRFFPSTGTGDM